MYLLHIQLISILSLLKYLERGFPMAVVFNKYTIQYCNLIKSLRVVQCSFDNFFSQGNTLVRLEYKE